MADKEVTKKETQKELKNKKEALRTFRFNVTHGKTRNVREGRALRKDIARILTAVNSKKNND